MCGTVVGGLWDVQWQDFTATWPHRQLLAPSTRSGGNRVHASSCFCDPVMIVLDIRDEFDRLAWQIAQPIQSAPTVLVTWTVTPEPVDAGMPMRVAEPFSDALAALGPVLFAGDPDHQTSVAATCKIPLRRGLRRHDLFLFRASTGAQVLPAFSSGRHDWSMGAQWLVVIDRAAAVDTELGALVKQLFEDWSFPERWPGALRVIIQAAVDGDGAACHCRDPAVRDELIDAMQRSAGAYGAQLRVNMASPGQPQA